MTKKIKSFMLAIFCLLINAALAFNIDSFGDNIHSNDGWKVFGDTKIITPFTIVFPSHDVSPKLGNTIYNSYDVSKGNGLEISFKPSIKKGSMPSRKKNGIKSFDFFSKNLVKNLAEINNEKDDLIKLSFNPVKKNPEKFKLSIFQSSKGQINFSNIGNFHLENLICIQIINNNLLIYYNEKNVRTINIGEMLGQSKIYITMLSSLSRKLILNDFKSKTLSEIPKRKPDIPHSENKLNEPLLKDFPKLRKLSKSNNYINLWVVGEKNEKVNYISDSFSIEPTEIYVKEQKEKKKLDSKFYTISQTNIPIKIKLIWNKRIDKCQKMFQGCTNIISIDFSNIEMNCDKMDFMFEGCSKLEKIELKNVQTSNVEDMSSMFNGCINLKFINLLSFDTSKVISMESMFKNCQSLKIIDLSNFKTPKLINMKSMFENCNQLKHLNIENFSTENCQIMNIFLNNVKI